jgi:hypothetical protein
LWRLCHLVGGELDQIQFLLGHVSIQSPAMWRLGRRQGLFRNSGSTLEGRLSIEVSVCF